MSGMGKWFEELAASMGLEGQFLALLLLLAVGGAAHLLLGAVVRRLHRVADGTEHNWSKPQERRSFMRMFWRFYFLTKERLKRNCKADDKHQSIADNCHNGECD